MNYERLNQLEIDYALQSQVHSKLRQELKVSVTSEQINTLSIEIDLCKSSMLRIKNEFESILDCTFEEEFV